VRLDDSAADFHAVVRDEWQMGVDTYAETVDFTASHAASSVELSGTTSWANTFRFWDETIAVDQAPFAKVRGSRVPEGGRPTITPLAGRAFFNPDELVILLDLVNAPGTVTHGLARVLGAGARLVAVP
jgi:hypothetical protein